MIRKILPVLLLSAVFFSACVTATSTVKKDGTTVYNNSVKKIADKNIIEGNIIDSATGKGIKGARIEIKNANKGIGYYLRESDSSGYFKIDDFIHQVRYVMEVSADGYVSYRESGNISSGSYTMNLEKEAILTGIVKDLSGKPVKDVEVKLSNRNYGEYGYTSKPQIALTNSEGIYIFNKLKKGSYQIYFTKSGYITENARIERVKSGETFRLPMVLSKPSSISGKVKVSGLDAPAVNVSITAKARQTYYVSTYPDGTFNIEDIKPGKYKLTISHEGFNTYYSGTITVTEGKNIKDQNFEVTPKAPGVDINSYRYTFTPGDSLEFNLRTFRLETVRATIYKVPIKIFLAGGNLPDNANPENDGFEKVLSWEEAINEFRPYEWKYQSMQIKNPLATGGYCIEIKGAGNVVSRRYFTVSSIGVVVKRSPDTIFAYTSNLIDNSPVADAKISLFDSSPEKNKKYEYNQPSKIEELPTDVLLGGKTDDNGIFSRKFKSGAHLTLLSVSPDGSYAICNTGSPQSFESEKTRYFIYTERPVYRAGDTVYYKIIGKTRKERFVPVENRTIYYKIVNRDMQKTITEGELSLDEWGTVNGKLKLESDTTLGDYEVFAGPDSGNLLSSGIFYVEQYRKPEYFIEITPSKAYFINGDTAEFKIESKYFFGAPLKNALVKYRFYETILSDRDGYWWEDGNSESRPYNRIKLEGEKYSDENGIVNIQLAAGTNTSDREITVEATVVDATNVSITETKTVKIGRGDFYIKINPSQNFYSNNEKKEIEIITLDHTGKAVSAAVSLDMYRYIWKPAQRVYVRETKPVFSRKISTDETGKKTIELPKKFELSGEFDFAAEALDRRDNRITASKIIWIYDTEGSVSASKFKNLEISLNNSELTGAKEITALVKSRFLDSYVCLTLEGRDIYETKVVKMTGNIVPVKFNIRQQYAPNLFLSAVMQRKKALYMTSAGISLPTKDTGLFITIKPESAKYKPGEKARVEIKVTNSEGKPVKADISLGAVDESIYYIRRDHTPKMVDYFYTKISNWILTSYSFPLSILAGAGKDGKTKVREKFEDTAFWKADIKTNAAGIAYAEFTLPDNLTTWRLTARGHDLYGRVGENIQKFLVTQDLIARVGKPRFFTEGDSVGIIGIVNSNTDRGLENVKTEMKIDGKETRPDKETKISLPSFGTARNFYTYNVPDRKTESTLEFSSKADTEAADAVKYTVPVERKGSAYKLYGTGDMSFNKTVDISQLKDSDDFEFIPEKITISVNPSPAISMIQSMKFLDEYPYGCMEQTINKFIPNLALMKLMEKNDLGKFIDKKISTNLDDKVKAGIDKVQGYQNEDGTWGWWNGDRGNAFLTGYVLYSLYIANSQSNTSVNSTVVENGLTAVNRILSARDIEGPDAYAYLSYIYALWGKWNDAGIKKIISLKERNPYQLAFSIRAISAGIKHRKFKGEKLKLMTDTLNTFLTELKAMQKKDGRGIYWQTTGSQRWDWPGGNTEITAHVLSALVESGDKSTIPSQIVKSLSNRARDGSWTSTKETASSIFSIIGYIDENGIDMKLKGNIDFKLNSEKITNVKYNLEENNDLSMMKKTIPLKNDSAVKNFTLEAAGDAGGDASFDAVISGTLNYKAKGFLSIFKTEDKSLKNLSNGISVLRTFSAITRVRDLNRTEYLVPQSLADRKEINAGDEILVKLKFVAEDDFKYLVLEDFLPSGFEVTKKNAYDDAPFVHSERWDNRMVFFFNDLKKGEVYETAYIVRAELHGKFMVRPARMECMYEPSIQGWSAPAIIEVKKKD